MSTYYHPDVLDNGLSTISGQSVSVVLCQTRPYILRDAQDLQGSGGMRISDVVSLASGDMTLQDDGNEGRQVAFGLLSFVTQVATTTDPIWIALHNGTNILATSLVRETHSISNGDPVELHDLKFGFAQLANQ